MEIKEGDYVLGLWQIIDKKHPIEILFSIVKPFGEKCFEVEARSRLVMDNLDPHDPDCKDIKKFKRWTMAEETTEEGAIESMRNLQKKAAETFDAKIHEVLVQSSSVDVFLEKIKTLPGMTARTIDPKTKEGAEELKAMGIKPEPVPS